MNVLRVTRYFGMTLLTGCSVGLAFTIALMIILNIEVFQAFLAITFFGSLTAVGGFAVSFNVREKEAVPDEAVSP